VLQQLSVIQLGAVNHGEANRVIAAQPRLIVENLVKIDTNVGPLQEYCEN
jgi:hypothetical protein